MLNTSSSTLSRYFPGYFLGLLLYLLIENEYAWRSWLCFLVIFQIRKYLGTPRPPRRLPKIRVHPLLQISATEAGEKIKSGEVTSVQLVELVIDHIERVNSQLNAIVWKRYDEARKEAEEADKRIKKWSSQGKDMDELPWLLGVPGTIKEVYALANSPQTAGVVGLEDRRTDENAPHVKRIQAAGGIIIGKTNISEVCLWMESHNYVYGTTLNAYDRRHTVGGSSGGEGCAQSAYFGYFGLGSDVGGSIRMPASFNGVFGHKPSTRLVPNKGQFPGAADKANFLLVSGPICRHVEDLYPMLMTLSKDGWDEEYSEAEYPRCRIPKNPNLVIVDRKIKVFALPTLNIPLLKACPSQQEAVRRATLALQRNFGCTVHFVDWKVQDTIPKGWANMSRAMDMWSCMMDDDSQKFEHMVTGHPLTGTEQPRPFRCGRELLKNFLGKSNHGLAAIGLGLIEKVKPYAVSGKQAKEFIALAHKLREDIEAVLGDNGVILTPTHPIEVPRHHDSLHFPLNWLYTALFNAMQSPVTNVPCWLTHNQRLPLGIQVVGKWGNDQLTIAVGRALEECTPLHAGDAAAGRGVAPTSLTGFTHRPPNWVLGAVDKVGSGLVGGGDGAGDPATGGDPFSPYPFTPASSKSKRGSSSRRKGSKLFR